VRSSPRWWGPYLAAWWWADGNHPLSLIREMLKLEFDRVPDDLAEFFSFLQEMSFVVIDSHL